MVTPHPFGIVETCLSNNVIEIISVQLDTLACVRLDGYIRFYVIILHTEYATTIFVFIWWNHTCAKAYLSYRRDCLQCGNEERQIFCISIASFSTLKGMYCITEKAEDKFVAHVKCTQSQKNKGKSTKTNQSEFVIREIHEYAGNLMQAWNSCDNSSDTKAIQAFELPSCYTSDILVVLPSPSPDFYPKMRPSPPGSTRVITLDNN